MKKYLSLPFLLALSISLIGCQNENTDQNTNKDQAIEEKSNDTTSEDTKDQKELADYSDISGDYQGQAEGFGGDINVDVSIENGKIKDINIEESETKSVGSQALKRLK